ncbi:MAG TPA: DNA polymerase/3'-5' exonuclease PolX [Gemmatimonadaceae bacterium]
MPSATISRTRPRSPGHEVENSEVARLFRELADVLEVEGANPFRIRAYRSAARTIESLPEPVATTAATGRDALTAIPGIGDDLAGKIEEIVRSGRLAALAAAARAAPAGAVDLMRIPGIGPKRARTLCESLHVRSLAGLERAARAGRVRELRGFGARTERKILDELAARGAEEQRIPRAVAAQYAEPLLAHMRALDGLTRAELAGSYRRCRETVGDLDILVSCERGAAATAHFLAYPEVVRVLSHGPTRASVQLRSGLRADLRVLPDASFGAGMHYFTGSKAHNIAVRRLGQERGLKINEYGIYRGTRRIGGRNEGDVFAAVGLPVIPPELREDRGEIQAAAAGTLPHLVRLADIHGDLQMHTTDSDGRDSLEAMAEAAQALGYEYIAITDHTPAVRIAGGMDRAGFRRQMRRIERLNGRLRGLTVLAGAEVDIHADGTLDLDDATLAALDVVVVAVHSRLDLAPDAQTRRLLRALAHPSVDIFAHPSGRLIGRRRAASFDHDAVFRAAAEHGVVVEVDAQPERLDLDDVACRAAIAHGVTLAIDSDAHAAAELRFMRWGVDQARRGWVERRHVANARPLAELRALLHGARR